MGNESQRCFLALRVNDTARRALGEVGEALGNVPRSAARRIKAVSPKNFHVTLKFLGETRPDQRDTLQALLTPVVTARPHPVAELVGLGAFPSPDRPRVIFAEPKDTAGDLNDLARTVDAMAEQVGFEREQREPHPHVTVARVDQARPRGALTTFIAERSSSPLGAVDPRALVLFSSELRPTGARHRPLWEIAFHR